jgi:hypothetical protein
LTSTAGAMFHQGCRSPRTCDLQQRKSNLEAIVGPRATFNQFGRKTARLPSCPMNLRLCNHIPRLCNGVGLSLPHAKMAPPCTMTATPCEAWVRRRRRCAHTIPRRRRRRKRIARPR